MGEVYRATDTVLNRAVALKPLPEAFAADPERVARFKREAQVLASLNHPHIAQIYGFETSGPVSALAMELVEGPTLADRIARGAMPLAEALPIARQIAEALEAAHEQGIIHRDLKPANIKLRPDGTVKVLDFGLAKALDPAGVAPGTDPVHSPTLLPTMSSPAMTRMGMILGTAAYMAPEQARGKAVDKRADIWAFGAVLYELITGRKAFDGEDVTETLAKVIQSEPRWDDVPFRVQPLLNRCLEKDPRKRLRDIGEARILLDDVLAGAPNPSLAGAAGISGPFWRRVLPWAVAGSLAVGLAALAWVHLRTANAPIPTAETTRFEIPLPEKTTLASNGVFALSPDGRQLAFAASGPDGVQRVWVRPLSSLEARPLPGSELPATGPFFWSFDSRYVAFGAGGKLKKIDVSGGPAQTLCDITAVAVVGGSWNRDGVIIFGQVPGAIMRVSANGGPASPLTTLDPSRSEFTHSFPLFLPDGRHFIYHRQSSQPDNSGVYVGSLEAKPEEPASKRLVATTYGAVYVPSSDAGSGQLLFFRDGTLMTQPFDTRRLELTGEAVTVAEQLGSFGGYGYFSASANGVLVYRIGGGGGVSQLTWFDRQGTVLGTAGEPGGYIALALSPDGARAAVTRYEQQVGNQALSLVDFSRGTSTRFTFGPSGALSGTWSPDGSRIIFFAGSVGGSSGLYQKLASGVKDEELLLESKETNIPTSWSRDGRFLLYMVYSKGQKPDLWVLPLVGDKKPFSFLRTGFSNSDGRFSPDGYWVAYVSDESGRPEIYVRTFSPDATAAASETGGKWLISTGGGTEPRWRGDGKELYYVAPDGKLMAVEMATNPVFRAGVPKGLFQAPSPGGTLPISTWDVTADGKRFLFSAAAQAGQAPFTIVQNWQAGLKK